MITVAGRARWLVRLIVARSSGWRYWGEVRGDFERALTALSSKTVSQPLIESERRRGRDHVRVTVTMTVAAADVAEALNTGWRAFRRAAGGDLDDWDTAGAEAEVRPAGA